MVRVVVVSMVAAAAGLFACMWTRSRDATTRAAGWPFPFEVFRYEHGHWVDYCGPGWRWAANFAMGFVMVFLPGFWIVARVCSRAPRKVG